MKIVDLPNFEATWWPIVLETVQGSGEKITIAIVVRGADGKSSIRQTIQPNAIRLMFGEAGKGMVMIIAQTVHSLHRQLEGGIKVEAVEPPFGGIAVGMPRDCIAKDTAEVFEVATHMATAFGLSKFDLKKEASTETQKAFEEWAEKIKMQAVHQQKLIEVGGAFNVTVPLSHRKKARFGFLRGSYAANFGVLRPGKSGYADVRALKLKLFDLDMLRGNKILSVTKAEVIVGCPDLLAESAFPKAEADRLNDSWQFIAEAARGYEIEPSRYDSAADAANHLLLKVAA